MVVVGPCSVHDPAAGLEEERHYGKLLLWMVLALIFGGFVIGIAITLVFGTAL